MVLPDTVKSYIASVSVSDPVAVFAGATNGIGCYSLLAFAKHTIRPKIHFIGRSEDQGQHLLNQLKSINPEGEYIFHKADLSLMKNVDQVCARITEDETGLDLLFMSQGVIKLGNTAEGLPLVTAVSLHSRLRMAQNLLPLLQRGKSLRRVISVFAGGKEGKLYLKDISGHKVPSSASRGHIATAMTLGFEGLAKQAPEVAFVHSFPGFVETNLFRKDAGWIVKPVKYFFKLRYWSSLIGAEETGERYVFLSTSGRYPSKTRGEGEEKSLEDGLQAAKGSNGVLGSGVYTVDEYGESCENTAKLLNKYRKEGAVSKIWQSLNAEFEGLLDVVD